MDRKKGKTGFGGWLFLLLVLVAHGVVALLDPEAAGQALRLFGKVMQGVLPALVITFVLLLATDLFFQPKWIRRRLGREAGATGWLLAAVGGVLATGPVYAWYPLLGELREKGMHPSLAAVFLYSRAIKLPLLPVMIHYFGGAYTLVLCFYILGFSAINGALVAKLDQRTAPPG